MTDSVEKYGYFLAQVQGLYANKLKVQRENPWTESIALERSFVKVEEPDGGQKWIVRRAPSPATAVAALKDVLDQNARLVVTLIDDLNPHPSYIPTGRNIPCTFADQASGTAYIVKVNSIENHDRWTLRVLSIATVDGSQQRLVIHLHIRWPASWIEMQKRDLASKFEEMAVEWMYLAQVVDSCNHDCQTCQDPYRGIQPTIIVESSYAMAFDMCELILFSWIARRERWLLQSRGSGSISVGPDLHQEALQTIVQISAGWEEAWPSGVVTFAALCSVVAAMRTLDPAQRPNQGLPSNEGYRGRLFV